MLDYEKLKIKKEDQYEEAHVIEEIKDCIAKKESWLFDAGAGSGKTYTLIQSINSILNSEGDFLRIHNQKILCITFTNAAADEIKDRIFKTPLVSISTIHEHMWNLISTYQKELFIIHKQNISKKLKDIEQKFSTEDWATKYMALAEEEKRSFHDIVVDKEFREAFYKAYDNKAAPFKASIKPWLSAYPNLLELISNVGKFKTLVNNIIKKEKYDLLISSWTKKTKNQKIIYEPRINNDRLERFLISHDTLLDYAYQLIKKYDLLKRIFCDQYPYVLVDEYQDTNEKVVQILNLVAQYAEKINHNFVVGYYGDVCQNIYDDGIGEDISRGHNKLVKITKIHNRRSAPKIIAVANAIRNDKLKQKSIYSGFPSSTVLCYLAPKEINTDLVVEELTAKWKIDKDNTLHCLVLKNETVAEKNKFYDIYSFFRNSKYFKTGQNYSLLRDALLAQEENKLCEVARMLYRLMDFKAKVDGKKASIKEILGNKVKLNYVRKELTVEKIQAFIEKLHRIEGQTLEEYLNCIFSGLSDDEILYNECIKYVFIDEIMSIGDFKKFIKKHLFYLREEDQEAAQKGYDTAIQEFMNIGMDQFKRWFDYVNAVNTEAAVVYHTFHSTKGREFDNLLIFATNKFSGGKNYFGVFLDLYKKGVAIPKECREARNLLYVAVTRARKNLCFVYLLEAGEDKQKRKEQLEQFFTKVEELE